MPHPLEDTIDLPRKHYLALLVRYSKALLAENEKDLPRTKELRQEIETQVARSRASGVKLDDESVKASPEAAKIRAALDKIMPEFQDLATRAGQRLALSRSFREKAEKATHGQETVAVPTGEVMVLIGLAEPSFEEDVGEAA